MRILAIETSCDETGVAIVEGEKTSSGFVFRVLGSALLSQAALHAQFGGVFPTLAKREHQKNLPIILKEAIESAGMRTPVDVDAIAVTRGPGLEPALWTGITFAQTLAEEWALPLFAANHMEGHFISSLVRDGRLEHIELPVLGLLISGGHTEFVLMRDWFEYEIIGETLDDAVGEAFDKVARMLELPYPGGPEISKLADRARRNGKGSQAGETSSFKLPRPMLQSKTCDVSFSGLKTAALYALRGKTLDDGQKAAFAREFEDAVADVFVAKTRRALGETDAKTFVIGGGVAANRYIRERLQALVLEEFPDTSLRLPELAITGDNAIMIAEASLARVLSGRQRMDSGEELRAVGNLSIAS